MTDLPQKKPGKLHSALEKRFKRSGGMYLSDIRRSRWAYFISYSLELILFAVREQFLPMGGTLFGISGWAAALAAYMIASLIFMLAWQNRFRHLILISTGIMAVGFLPFVFLPMGTSRLLFGILFYIGLGGAVTSCRCGYAFAANNAERLAGMLIVFFAVAVIRFLAFLGADGVFFTHVLPLALLIALCYCLLQYKEEDFEVRENTAGKDTGGLYWAFAFFLLFSTFDGYNSALTEGRNNPDFLLFFIGLLLAGAILYLTVVKLGLNTWFIWNIFFAASVGMGLFAFFSAQLGTEGPQYFFGGLSMIGWPLSIYTLGCAQRRFASYRLLKRCTLIYVVLSPVFTLSGKIVAAVSLKAVPLAALLFVLAAGIAFLMLSPLSYRQMFSAAWMPDIYKADMQLPKEEEEKKDCFHGYQLTPRQKEIAALLLAAKTRRQIAAELGLSESTVKMHAGELYRRLGINSRTELFCLFGVSEE